MEVRSKRAEVGDQISNAPMIAPPPIPSRRFVVPRADVVVAQNDGDKVSP